MPRITAILHTRNDGLRIARTIVSLRSCDEVLVIDHGSTDETCAVARRFGAHVLEVQGEEKRTDVYLQETQNDWICCLRLTEYLYKALEASVLEWKFGRPERSIFWVTTIEETWEGWPVGPVETRLAHRERAQWQGWKPQAGCASKLPEGVASTIPVNENHEYKSVPRPAEHLTLASRSSCIQLPVPITVVWIAMLSSD